jgi:hypothetical protein
MVFFLCVVTYAMGRLEDVADIAWVSVPPHHGRLLKRPKRDGRTALLAERLRSARQMKRRATSRSRTGTSHRTPHSSPMTLPPPKPARYDMLCSRSAVHIPNTKLSRPPKSSKCVILPTFRRSVLPPSNLRTLYSHGVMRKANMSSTPFNM